MSVREGLTQDELDAERGEQLPEREAMSIVDLGEPGSMTAMPVPTDTAESTECFPDPDREPVETHPAEQYHNPAKPPE